MDVSDVLREIFYNPRSGFMNRNALIKRAHEKQVKIKDAREWYGRQAVNQIIMPRRRDIVYHKIIGDGDGYQADIIFLPSPRLNKGYIGLLTFINTSTRKAYVAKIKNRTTEELIDKIDVWLDHVEETWGRVKSITTDNELYNNIAISRLFEDSDVEHFVEFAGTHIKLGIINRFHRTLRDMLAKVMIGKGEKSWVNVISDVIANYNSRVNRTTGKAPNEMTRDDIAGLNKKLEKMNKPSIAKMHGIKVGDRVRYLEEKSRFAKGGKRFSESIWTVTGLEGYNFSIENGGEAI